MSLILSSRVPGIAGADAQVLRWWRAMCALAALNVCLWLAVWYLAPVAGFHGGLQLTLSGVYVLVCAYRSVFPRGISSGWWWWTHACPTSFWDARRPRWPRSASRSNSGC